MPKKKFITAPTAKYTLLPGNGAAAANGTRWIRTDVNDHFEPFQDSGTATAQQQSASNSAARQSITHTRPLHLNSESPLDHYDYDCHLRAIGDDPSAIFFSARQLEGTRNTSSGDTATRASSVAHHIDELDRGEAQGGEVDLELTDIESNSSSGNEEYEDFFQQIIGTGTRQSNTVSTGSHALPNIVRSYGTKVAEKVDESQRKASTDAQFNAVLHTYDDSSLLDVPAHSNKVDILSTLNSLNLLNETQCDAVSIERTLPELDQMKIQQGHTRTREANGTCVDNIRSKLDCETVVSSYSISENCPRVLPLKESRAKRILSTSTTAFPESSSAVLATCQGGQNISRKDEGSWRQNTRRKGETREEKKSRKAAVKLGRQEARQHKKLLKHAFKEASLSVHLHASSNVSTTSFN